MAPKIEKPILCALTLDFETGGLKCQTSACTQIALHATRLDTFEKIGSYVAYISPYYKKEIKGVGEKKKVLRTKYEQAQKELMDYEEKALTYSAITMDMLENQGKPIEVVAQELIQFLTDIKAQCKCTKATLPFLIGQNIPFDEGFLCQLFEYAGLIGELKKLVRGHEDFYGHWHPLYIDTIVLGQLAIPDSDSYKLELLCDMLGVPLIDAHDADADVSATTNVVSVLTQRMRNLSADGEGQLLALSKPEKTRKHFKI